MIDFSDIDAVREVVEHCNRIPVHPRHPYGGDLVHTAFSGTHQDAIAKGFMQHAKRAAELGVPAAEAPWDVPYLPIDPGDIGRTYDEVIRINSQSGKGGIAHLLQVHHGLDLPARMRPDFARAVQRTADATGRELSPDDLWRLFQAEYLAPGEAAEPWRGSLSALIDALRSDGIDVDILSYSEHSVGSGHDAPAAAYAECRVDGLVTWGAGWDSSVLTAAVHAVRSAVNRGRI
jgi:2-isopropylmalate synthase